MLRLFVETRKHVSTLLFASLRDLFPPLGVSCLQLTLLSERMGSVLLASECHNSALCQPSC
jgi:hypothetical protein